MRFKLPSIVSDPIIKRVVSDIVNGLNGEISNENIKSKSVKLSRLLPEWITWDFDVFGGTSRDLGISSIETYRAEYYEFYDMVAVDLSIRFTTSGTSREDIFLSLPVPPGRLEHKGQKSNILAGGVMKCFCYDPNNMSGLEPGYAYFYSDPFSTGSGEVWLSVRQGDNSTWTNGQSGCRIILRDYYRKDLS